jgi:hypothetical protein
VVRFNQHWMTVPSATTSGATAGTIFYLAKHDSSPPPGSAGAGAVAFNWGGAADNEFEPFGDSKIYQDFGSTVRYGSIAVPSSFASWQIYVYRAESGRWRCYQGGGVAAKDSGTNTVAWSASPTLGNASSVTLIGHVAELVFYRAALTNAQVNGVGAYLANKYAVSWSTV